METFNDDIKDLRRYIDVKTNAGQNVRVKKCSNNTQKIAAFLNKKTNTIVFKEDTWVELGNPKTFSMAPVLVTESLDVVNDGAITLIGPDIQETQGSIPFAQILLLSSTDLKDENYRKLNTFQYELELNGYMIKAVPSSMTIWSRVSKDSVKAGFSFEILGNAIIQSYRSKFNIQSAEVIFITSSEEDVKELKDLNDKVKKIVNAMSKMMEEMSYDCSSCEYVDVCDDVRELGQLREKLMKNKTAEGGEK